MQESPSLGVHWNICLRPEPTVNDDKAWPALGTENQPKDCQMREDEETTTAVATTSLPIIQTDFRPPVFFESVQFPKFCVHVSTPERANNEDEAVGDHGNESHKKYRLPLICKRQDKIYINLPSIAQEAIHLKSRYAKGEHLKMCPNPTCKSCNPLKKVNGVIAKVRKMLKPKRIILLQQVLKAQGPANRQKRRLFDAAKYEAISRAVDAIGIGALMITNPETDTDYTKRMFELSVYDKNCQRAETAGSSDSQRPDLIIDRLTRLKLEKKDDEETVNTPATVSQGWRSWHKATSSKIFSERSDQEAPNCSRNFSE